ncbi:MAG: ribosome hibernation-promoting factor, HPF/YfiA family [Planctomycetota bacterium]
MSVLVTVRDGDAAPEMKQYAEEKGEKLRRFFNGLTKVEITLGAEGLEKRVEIVASIARGETIAVHAVHEQMNGAIDLAMDKAEKRVVRHKEKLRSRRSAQPEPGALLEEPEVDRLESYDEIIDQTDFPKP